MCLTIWGESVVGVGTKWHGARIERVLGIPGKGLDKGGGGGPWGYLGRGCSRRAGVVKGALGKK